MSAPATRPRRKGGIRAERALGTRRAIISAAYKLFCEHGYAGTTVTDIAAEAGVAVQTVYFTFGTKAAVLGEVLGAAVVGFDQWTGAPPEPVSPGDLQSALGWYEAFTSAPDAYSALAAFIAHGTPIYARTGPLLAALHGASGDPEAAAVLRLGEERRVDAYREAVRVLSRKPPGLRAELNVTAATDILLVLSSAEVYQGLVAGRGWSQRRYIRFLTELLSGQLLATPESG
jgi:AcrR family transcriptional regulator